MQHLDMDPCAVPAEPLLSTRNRMGKAVHQNHPIYAVPTVGAGRDQQIRSFMFQQPRPFVRHEPHPIRKVIFSHTQGGAIDPMNQQDY